MNWKLLTFCIRHKLNMCTVLLGYSTKRRKRIPIFPLCRAFRSSTLGASVFSQSLDQVLMESTDIGSNVLARYGNVMLSISYVN